MRPGSADLSSSAPDTGFEPTGAEGLWRGRLVFVFASAGIRELPPWLDRLVRSIPQPRRPSYRLDLGRGADFGFDPCCCIISGPDTTLSHWRVSAGKLIMAKR